MPPRSHLGPAVSSLADIGHVLESVERPPEQLQRALELLSGFVPYDHCALLDAASGDAPRMTITPAAAPEEHAALRARLVALHELVADRPAERRATEPLPGSGAGSAHLAVPLIALDEAVGILFVQREPEPYELHHLQLLSVAAAQIGAYLAKARLQAEEQKAGQAMRRVANLLQYMRDGFMEFDERGTCVSVNPAAPDLLGVPADEILGRDVRELLDLDRTGAAGRAVEQVLEEAVSVQLPAAFAKDRRRWFECDFYATELGGSVIVRDITARREAEEIRDLFVGVIGHDLRTPLGAIMLSARTLLKREGLGGRNARTAARIADSAARMSEMVAQLLDLTRIRLGRGVPLRRRPADLGEVCRRAADELQHVNPKRRIEREISGDLSGHWDGDRLIQVVSNLLDNALRHGDPDAPIRLRVWASAPHTVSMEVRNEGPPIPPEMMPALFHPFRKGSAEAAGSRSSLGLGLFIAHTIVEAHDGRIDVRSTHDEGTRFTVHLPRRARSEDEQAREANGPEPGAAGTDGRLPRGEEEGGGSERPVTGIRGTSERRRGEAASRPPHRP